MATRETAEQHGRREARRAVAEICAEFRGTRVRLGRSQSTVAQAAGFSRSYYARIERGEIRSSSFGDLWAVGAVLGLDLRLAAYPAGEPVHDHVQLPMLQIAQGLVAAAIPWRTEVTLPIAGDRRAWDAVAMTPDGWTAFEAISKLGAVDATIRRVNGSIATIREWPALSWW